MFSRGFVWVLPALACVVFASCGGGGSTGAPVPVPPAAPQVLPLASTFTVTGAHGAVMPFGFASVPANETASIRMGLPTTGSAPALPQGTVVDAFTASFDPSAVAMYVNPCAGLIINPQPAPSAVFSLYTYNVYDVSTTPASFVATTLLDLINNPNNAASAGACAISGPIVTVSLVPAHLYAFVLIGR
jgi:hypothetical protein